MIWKALHRRDLLARILMALFISGLVALPSITIAGSTPRDGIPNMDAAHANSLLNPLDWYPTSQGPAHADDPAPSKYYGLRFQCPPGRSQVDPQVVVLTVFCPNHIIDLEDFLGQPVLAVDPQNPNLMAFHSLHGGSGLHLEPPLGDGPPPSERSRFNTLHQPHTEFFTDQGGSQWIDNRYYAPDSLSAPGRIIYGEDNAVTMDAEGNVYLASLYSWRDEAESDYGYTVATWKGGRANRPINYYENLQILHAPDDVDGRDNVLQDLFLTYSKESNRVVVSWLETRPDGSVSASGLESWVTAYSTPAGEGLHWDKLPEAQQVGPCRRLARPVSFGGQIFFACLPGADYKFGQGAGTDSWQVHSLDATTLSTQYAGPTPVASEEGLLVDFAHTGHMLFIGTTVDSDGRPHVWVTKGALGKDWTDAKDFGEKLVRAPPGVDVEEARVTAAAYTEQTGYIHLLYMERYSSTPDAQNLATGQVRMFNKTYAVLRWGGDTLRWQGKFDNLGHGQLVSGIDASPHYKGLTGDVLFNGLHDDIVVWQDPRTDRERVFTVFDDYGMIRFAEVVEQNAYPAIPLPPLGAPPIPLAVQAANASAQTVAAGVLAALMLLRMLLAKKKATLKVTA